MRNILLAVALLFAIAPSPRAQTPSVDPRIERMLAAISAERLRQSLVQLTAFGTRHTLSDTVSTTRGIGAARRWIASELRRVGTLQVSEETFRLRPQGEITREVDVVNVLAVLPGRSARRIYVTAHYDSINRAQPEPNADADAPGADDNASGVALTLELARVLGESGVAFDATLVFALWAGEEQGLFGSRVHARRLGSAGGIVTAVLNSDIVGGSRGGNGTADGATVRVFSEGPEDSASRALARFIKRTAAAYVPAHRVRLIARKDRFARSSDHLTFNEFGFPAIVFREAHEDYSRQHSAKDTLDGVDAAYLARNARVTAAAAAALALAPPAPVVVNEAGDPMLGRGKSGYDASLQWKPSPGATAYRIYWRDGWASDWQQQQLVGNVTTSLLPNISIDNVVVGVAAVGADGHESAISGYVIPARTFPPEQLAH